MRKIIATRTFGLSILVVAAFACNTSKNNLSSKGNTPMVSKPAEIAAPPPPEPIVEVKAADAKNMFSEQLTLPDSLPIYRATARRDNDIIHSSIDVRFDWAKRHCLGNITITAKPHFYTSEVLELDAKGMEIKRVEDADRRASLKYDYDGEKLRIQLGRLYTRNDQYRVFIEYVGKPEEAYKGGGSEAISSDKGLFFINHDGKDPNKPKQIWTQGETESNSHWFPTIDKPNERMTVDLNITVENKYKTLSNGLLTGSRSNLDGTRTDTWKMDKAHAPYLVMMAVGEYAVVRDRWRNMDLMYYVELKYERYAKTIFKNTPEMLTFFSERLGVDYPWQKYAQVVVRDYVSGAMENTTASIFGEYMQGTDRELIDVSQNESVVAHEMFHQWFGDLVTCESWANLTVNESFANYSESLWFEHKYGEDAGMHHLYEDMEGYLDEAQTKIHPLVYFRYDNREDMFDRHSYNKGGCTLHMLRKYLGDDAFFASLKKYLTDNAYSTGESHQLRLAIEAVTGEDMNWFFNQWYFSAGHPVLDIAYNYDEATKKMRVTIEQKQEPKEGVPAIFELPMAVDIYHSATNKERKLIRMTKRKQTFEFNAPQKPALVNVDAEKMLLAEKKDNHTEEEWAFMYRNCPKYLDRREALEFLKDKRSDNAKAIVKEAINDKFWAIRNIAIKAFALRDDPSVADKFMGIATADAHSQVRAAAVSKLAATRDKKYIPTFQQVLEREQAYPVIASAMTSLYKLSPEDGLAAAKRFESDENGDLLNGVGEIYAQSADSAKAGELMPFFEKNLNKADGMSAISFIGNYTKLLDKAKLPSTNLVEKLAFLKNMATDQSISPWKRFACAKAINEFRKKYMKDQSFASNLAKMLVEIKQKETNGQLKAVYDNMLP